jgi:hypothetical protein
MQATHEIMLTPFNKQNELMNGQFRVQLTANGNRGPIFTIEADTWADATQRLEEMGISLVTEWTKTPYLAHAHVAKVGA